MTDSIYDLMGNGFTTPLTAGAAASTTASTAAAATSPAAAAASNPAVAAAGRASKDERHAHVDRVFQVNQQLLFLRYR